MITKHIIILFLRSVFCEATYIPQKIKLDINNNLFTKQNNFLQVVINKIQTNDKKK